KRLHATIDRTGLCRYDAAYRRGGWLFQGGPGMTRNGQSALQRQLGRGGAIDHDGLQKEAVVEAAHQLGLALMVADCDRARSRSAVLRAIAKAVDFPEYFGGN